MKFRNLKRAITLILVFTITFSCVQWPGTFTSEYLRAAALESFDENDSYVSDELQIKSTNSFGDLLTTPLKDKFDEQSGENSDFCVYSVEIKDNSAIVSYTSLFDCNLTVAIYDNDGRKMYTSASTKVKSSENETKIEIQDVLPEYYLVKAYLTMSDSLAPLCQVYENNTYTEHMQSFLSKTILDFEEDRVLCLDEEATSNFAVFSEDVIVIENEIGYNTVSSCDNENGVYIIENINKTVASLQPGDVFAYNYNNINDMIIVKIDTIDITENTATIRAAETSIEEVFDHLRYEVDDAMEHANFDTNGIPNVLYSNFDDLNDYTIEETARVNTPSQIVETSSNLSALPNPMKNTSKPESKLEFDATLDVDTENDSVTGTGSITATIAFSPNLDEFDTSKTIKTPYGELPAAKTNVAINTSFTGSATVTLKASIKIYFAKDDDNNEDTKNTYVEIKFINKTEFYAGFDTSINVSIPLWNTYFPYYGFCIEFTPKIVINTTGKAEVSAVFTSTKGVEFKNGQMKRINPKGEVDIKFNGEVTVTVKLDIGPKCYFISEKLATVDTEFSFGIRVNAKLELEKEYSYEEDSENGTVTIEDKIDKHDCSTLLTEGDCGCIKGTVTGVGAVAGEIKFLNSSSFKLNLLKAELHLLDFYYSLKYNEFGKGICPHKFYYYELNINDINGDKIEDAEVYVSEKSYKTDKNGKVLVYLSPGENKVKINKENYKEEELTLELTSSYNTKYKNDSGLGFNEKVESESTTTANKSDSATTQTTVSTKKLNVNVDLDIADISYDIEETVKINGDEKRSDVIVLKPEPHEVAVKVVDEKGSPVKGVKIESDYEYAEIDLLNTTNTNGIKKLELPNGEWTITASKKGYTSVSETVTVEGDDTEITITIIGNSCTFTVTDQYGDPVNGAKLNFTNTLTGENVLLISPTTDENGLYAYSFNVGEYEFTATKKGYDDYEGSFTVPEGGTEVEVEMYCNLQKVTVIVEDESGNPLSGVSVKSYYDNVTSTTDDNGTVIIKLPVGETELRFIKDGYYTSKSYLTINEGEDITATFQLEAITDDTSSSGATWTFDEDTGVLTISGTGATGTIGDVYYDGEIRSVIIKDGITSISDYAFRRCSSLITITIPDSVTSIGIYAFYECDALTTIIIPDSVTCIGRSAFTYCSSLTSVTIPDSVISIGNSAFSACSSLTTITIPDSVTSIAEEAFWNCDALTSVTIGNSVLSIGNDAFSSCGSLNSVTIGNSVTSIGNGAFSYCGALTSAIIGNCVISIGEEAFIKCTSLTSITIPDNVTSIGSSAFLGCTNLSSITIPYGVTSIEGYSFKNCTSLTSITIPDSVTSIGDEAFRNCISLVSTGDIVHSDCENFATLTIPDTVTSIGNRAFKGCVSFTSLILPDSVTNMGDFPFSNCNIKTLIIAEGSEMITNEMTNLYNGTAETDDILFGYQIEKIIIPSSVTSIGEKAFSRFSSITSIEISDSITSIGNGAFSDCDALTKLIIADGSETITSEMTNGLKRVEEIVIPDSVTSIGKYAFANFDVLTEIIIPDSVTSIGEDAFYDCSALTEIIIPDSVTSIGKFAFYHCSALTEIIIPDSVTSIGNGAFSNCSALTSITIPGSVTSMGDSVFYDCNIKNLIIADGSETITSEMTNGLEKYVKEIVITDSVTSIGNGAFSIYSALTSITIPDSVTSIGEGAFRYCDALTDVYYTGTEGQWTLITIGFSNSDLTSATIHYNYTPEETAASSYILKNASEVQILSEETTESTTTTTSEITTTPTTSETTTTTSTTTVIDAVYIDLEPGRIYNFYALYSTEAEDLLSAENLIYMSQGTADENGMLAFGYLPKEEGVEAEHVIVGMIYCIEHADVAIKDMEYTGSELTPEIAITYDGKTLEKDKDYTLSGILNASKPGLYEVKVSGIGDYYGEKYVDYAINCEHKYADGICATCGTQCVHTYENGLCSECGDTLHITTTISTTVSTTTTSTTITSTTTTSTTSTSTTTLITTTTTSTTTSTNTTTTTTSTTSSNTTETVTTTSITNPSMTTEITQAQVYDELINKANKILEETGTTPIDIYGFVSNNNKYRYIEETRTLDEIESKGWAYYANYAINNRYVVQYYFAAITELLFQCAGYESRIVYGTGRGTGDHYWNQILIGGEWINYDACNGYYEVDDDYLKKQNYTYKEYLYPRFVPTIESEYLLGDVNNDGSVDSSDASIVLAEYAKIQTGGAGEFTETQKKAADVNDDNVVDSSDASKILAYYAMISTGKEPTWD